MKMKDNFWERIPPWLLNAGWIGQALTLAVAKVMHFIKEDGYYILLFTGAWIGIWGVWKKNKMQEKKDALAIQIEEVKLEREREALRQDVIHSQEIHEIRKARENGDK
jgi:hypothetical protein